MKIKRILRVLLFLFECLQSLLRAYQLLHEQIVQPATQSQLLPFLYLKSLDVQLLLIREFLLDPQVLSHFDVRGAQYHREYPQDFAH